MVTNFSNKTHTSSILFSFFKIFIMIGPIRGASIILTNNLNTNPVKCGAAKKKKSVSSRNWKFNLIAEKASEWNYLAQLHVCIWWKISQRPWLASLHAFSPSSSEVSKHWRSFFLQLPNWIQIIKKKIKKKTYKFESPKKEEKHKS